MSREEDTPVMSPQSGGPKMINTSHLLEDRISVLWFGEYKKKHQVIDKKLQWKNRLRQNIDTLSPVSLIFKFKQLYRFNIYLHNKLNATIYNCFYQQSKLNKLKLVHRLFELDFFFSEINLLTNFQVTQNFLSN